MKKNVQILRLYILNIVVYLAVFAGASALSIFALTRKIDSFSGSQNKIIFNVIKPEINISNTVPGRVDKILVKEGQRIKKDDLLIVLSDAATKAKLDTLNQISATNVSAQTEAKVIQATQSFYQIHAPQDGVIFRINVTEGTYLNQNSTIMVVYGNENIKLLGHVGLQDYTKFSGTNSFEMFSPRFAQNFQTTLEGAGRVIPGTQYDEAKYELQFNFADQNEGAAFIQGEGLQLVSKTDTSASVSSADKIANIVREFVAGIK